jgi:hypothetical protein
MTKFLLSPVNDLSGAQRLKGRYHRSSTTFMQNCPGRLGGRAGRCLPLSAVRVYSSTFSL